jgi:hypothetical protein
MIHVFEILIVKMLKTFYSRSFYKFNEDLEIPEILKTFFICLTATISLIKSRKYTKKDILRNLEFLKIVSRYIVNFFWEIGIFFNPGF